MRLMPLLSSIPYHLDAEEDEASRARLGISIRKLAAWRVNTERLVSKYPDDSQVRRVVWQQLG
jgi:hypothetical protein